MATSNSIFLMGLSGSLGGELTIKRYKDRVVVCKKVGERKKKATESQSENEMLFRAANRMAKTTYADPVKREAARLRLGLPHGMEVYRALVREFREELKKTDS